ncbi:MAG: selenide, water dikinase SelD [Bacteroidetes bacterium]|nr:selenide, water dikinase SelD [Bacteroidota bacterium]
MEPIYLDYNATTPLDPLVQEEMKPYLDFYFGNPSSSHNYGIKAREGVMLARKRVAAMLNCDADEIIFTSGGTESNNFAIKGVATSLRAKGNHIITSGIEHPAVTEVCRYLQKQGWEITWMEVDQFGMVNPAEIRQAIRPETILITVMHANNETGTVQPVSEIASIAHEHDVPFHTDAAQSIGKIPVDVQELGVGLLSVAGHKVYAPKGIGALYVRRGVNLEKLIHGADHEADRRAGTENVIGVVGLGKAAEIITNHESRVTSHESQVTNHQVYQQVLRDRLHEGIKQAIPEARLNGHPDKRLPNTLNLGFPDVDANLLLAAMKGVAASAGAACHAGEEAMTGVLAAMHVPYAFAMGTIRFSVGRMTTEEEILAAIPIIVNAYKEIRNWKSTSHLPTSPPPHLPSSPPSVTPVTSHELRVTSHESTVTSLRLTDYTHALGCACKIRPQTLEKILEKLPKPKDPRILAGFESSDDAAVYQISEKQALVQTVDVIPPVVDNPYYFGAIAASNALSDVYAMGGNPLYALNIVGFPGARLPVEVLLEILKGATDKVEEAGIQILGGHSIEVPEPLFGLTVTGTVEPGRVIRNAGLQPGDALVLTKPLGTGILSMAMKRQLVSGPESEKILKSMAALNNKAAKTMQQFDVHACTDITGFGLLIHLKEMTAHDPVDIELSADAIPFYKGVWECLAEGLIPAETTNNLDYISSSVNWGEGVSQQEKLLLCDPQTSGGLLIALNEAQAMKLIDRLKSAGMETTAFVGKCKTGKGKIIVHR